jgi:hypothetical protein
MYKTQDLGLVTALSLSGITHRETKQTGAIVFFAYDETEAFEEISDKYYRKDLPIDALTFATAFKQAKMLMFAKKGENATA